MVKQITGFASAMLLAFAVSGQNGTEVPHKVKINFMENFISASTTTWAHDKNGNYVADFMHQSQNKTAMYAKDGTWLSTETRLFPAQAPVLVLESLSNAFKTYDMEQVSQIETRLGLSFRFRIKMKNSIYEVEIDSAGKIMNKRKISDIPAMKEDGRDRKKDEDKEAEKMKEKEREEKGKKKDKHKKEKNKKN